MSSNSKQLPTQPSETFSYTSIFASLEEHRIQTEERALKNFHASLPAGTDQLIATAMNPKIAAVIKMDDVGLEIETRTGVRKVSKSDAIYLKSLSRPSPTTISADLSPIPSPEEELQFMALNH